MSRLRVQLRFLLGEKLLFSLPLQVEVRNYSLSAISSERISPEGLKDVDADLDGLLVNLMPIEGRLQRVHIARDHIQYAPRQYTRCYIDFAIGKEAYLEGFSSKTRSGLNRKVRKFEQLSGPLDLREYRQPEEMNEFFRLARQISAKTYQERLLNVGLPADEEYLARAQSLAGRGLVRAYVLCVGDEPVTYLFCPSEGDTLIYAYLGYDPAYAEQSPGGVLHWLVFQKLFDDGSFRYFDFGQGEGDHKRLFSTHAMECADVYLLKRNIANVGKVWAHAAWEAAIGAAVAGLDRVGIKKWLKKTLRRQ